MKSSQLRSAATGSYSNFGLDLEIAWIHLSETAMYNTDPDIQIHACDEYTYILCGAGRGARDDPAAGLA
jgi:hypothetical protein